MAWQTLNPTHICVMSLIRVTNHQNIWGTKKNPRNVKYRGIKMVDLKMGGPRGSKVHLSLKFNKFR